MTMKILKFTIYFLLVSGLYSQLDNKIVICKRPLSAQRLISADYKVTANQEKFDVTYYKLNLDLDIENQIITGQVMVRGFLEQNLNVIELDLFTALVVDSVHYFGNSVDFQHMNNLLRITIPPAATAGDTFQTEIFYRGIPGSTGFGSFGFNTFNDRPMIWSLSEPYGARNWWPCKDTPLDKADSIDILITVPLTADTLIVASNGLLINTEYKNDSITYFWSTRYPIATYLVSVAIYPYKVFHDWFVYGENDSMRLDFFVFPENYFKSDLINNYSFTKNMLEEFSLRFGLYPFIKEKYGHAEFIWGGGMEHQTITSLNGTTSFGYSQFLISHELSHQWWGDMITIANFHHIWLNEGFATYSQALWSEFRDGDIESLHAEMDQKVYYGEGTIYVEDTTAIGTIFNGDRSYNKASWVLHMLRHVVGDSTFFLILKSYSEDPEFRFGTVTTEQFRDFCESITNLDLHPFFDQWIYGEYYPIYKVGYEQEGDSLKVIIEQTSLGGTLFQMPLDIKITSTDTTFLTTIQNQQPYSEYLIKLPPGMSVNAIEVDPENWVLKKVTVTDLSVKNSETPEVFSLLPAFPNPFNSNIRIPLKIPTGGQLTIEILDLRGRPVWNSQWTLEPGYHYINWNGRTRQGIQTASGVYFVRAGFGRDMRVEKILLLR